MSAWAILTHLQFGRPVQRLVTIPEGMPSVLVHERLMRVPYLTGDIDVPVEGSVLPDTYTYRRGESRAAVLRRMQAAMRQRAGPALGGAAARRRSRRAREAAIILASIVEKETGKASERRLIAGVYSNRLRRGIPLQADPTVIYPVTRGRPLGRRILRSELQREQRLQHLLRWPGCRSGRSPIPAAPRSPPCSIPQPTNALYFVADGTGGHVFADTLAAA